MRSLTQEFSVLLSVVLSLAGAGCGTVPNRTPTVAIAVRLNGNAVPAPDHLAHIRAGLQPSLVRAGFALAEDPGVADYVVTVAFIPAISGQGGQVSVASFEPTRRFREAIDAGDTREAKEWRRRQREVEQWIERQNRADE